MTSVEEVDWPDEHLRRTEVVRALHSQLSPPPGWRVEIIEGDLVVSWAPTPTHAYTVELIRTAVAGSLPPTHGVYENVEFECADGERYVPDLGVWPRDLLHYSGARLDPGQCGLAVEVLTSRQHGRSDAKAAGYARCSVPVHLVVDRRRYRCIVSSDPEGDRYRDVQETPFGKPVTLPLETPVTIDTSRF